ncbi:MAG: hypothetical protein AAF826_11880 [Pseudomonadota bacterium]
MTEDLITLVASVSPARKFFGVFSLSVPTVLFAALLVQGAFNTPIAIIIGIGLMVAFAWAAWRMFSAPNFGIVFDGTLLATEDGENLAHVDDIATVQNGLFALRPTNGFMLVLKEPGKRTTRPGVVWQQGRSLGIGGILQSEPAKAIGRAVQEAVESR